MPQANALRRRPKRARRVPPKPAKPRSRCTAPPPAKALAEGSRLLDEAERAGVTARLLLAPDTAAGVIISVDYLRRPEDGTNLAE